MTSLFVVNGGSQDKTDQVTQSAQESQGTGSYVWFFLTWTSEEILWQIFSEYEEHWIYAVQ